ncbi:MAG: sodium-dependent bicarbonate transport family permease [Sumerlaeia bacterium]
MNLGPVLDNLLSAPVLFFVLGMLAVSFRSDLEVPQPLPKLFSLYLLMAIGFKGGVELNHSGLNGTVLLTLGCAVLLSCVVPIWTYFLLRPKIGPHNAAALAATYGSISAVTFIAAGSFIEQAGLPPYSGFMIAAMALMESPAIIIGVLLLKSTTSTPEQNTNWGELVHESFFNGSVVILMGSLIIGGITGEKGMNDISPLVSGLFKGVLCLFLLDMGIVAARRLGDLARAGKFTIGFAMIAPLVHALLGIAVAGMIGLGTSDALMLAVLAAGASYIAVPAAMRLSIPEANPSIYLPMALAITFPFNVVIGIPVYHLIIQQLWS